jgi:hypothetical protein
MHDCRVCLACLLCVMPKLAAKLSREKTKLSCRSFCSYDAEDLNFSKHNLRGYMIAAIMPEIGTAGPELELAEHHVLSR